MSGLQIFRVDDDVQVTFVDISEALLRLLEKHSVFPEEVTMDATHHRRVVVLRKADKSVVGTIHALQRRQKDN